MKYKLLRFLVSKAGGILTPFIAMAVAAAVAKLASVDAKLATEVDQTSVVGFFVALLVSLVNYWTNAAQTEGVKQIQALVNTDQDGIPGPITYVEVRKAIPVPKRKKK